MSGVWVIDIETVPLGTKLDRPNGMPDHWLEDEPYVAPQPKKVPSSYRDPEKIAAKQAELDTKNIRDAAVGKHKWITERLSSWKARALSPYTAEIVAIAMHPLDDYAPDDPGSVRVKHYVTGPKTERTLMQQLENTLKQNNVTHLVHWGSYDPPVLREAMCRHDLRLPRLERILRQKLRGRAWYPNCLDASILTHARHTTFNRGWGLKNIAAQLGWEDTAKVPSRNVYDAWLAGDYVGCCDRAAADVDFVLRILERERCISDVLDWAGEY